MSLAEAAGYAIGNSPRSAITQSAFCNLQFAFCTLQSQPHAKSNLLMRQVFFPALLLVSSLAAAAERPNFIFIYTDDQRWDTLGVVQREQGEKGRFPWLQSPNLDRLAAEGVRFRNAFVVNSLCAPSRSVFLTGRYNHNNGVANNHTPFPAENVPTTWSALLRDAGYATGYVGKFHHGQQPGKRPGFDYSASFLGQGRYFDCPFEVNGTTQQTTGWVDDVSTDFALGFLKLKREQPLPWSSATSRPTGHSIRRRGCWRSTLARRPGRCRISTFRRPMPANSRRAKPKPPRPRRRKPRPSRRAGQGDGRCCKAI